MIKIYPRMLLDLSSVPDDFVLSKQVRCLPKSILHRVVMSLPDCQLRDALKAEVCKNYISPIEQRRTVRDDLFDLKDEPLFRELFSSDWKMSQYEALVKDVKELLDLVSPTMCLSKWNEVTINLARSGSHSCCRTPLEIADLEEVKEFPIAIHNSSVKKKSRHQMLSGERPPECHQCWTVEDSSKHVSNRILLSINHVKDFYKILRSGLGDNYAPTQVELYSTSTCQLKCFYCGPLYSSAWKQELSEESSYKLRHGVMFELKPAPSVTNLDPFVVGYEKAIKEWYPSLRTLRFTGGEPLLATHTWRMLDYAKENPSPDLTISINSNLCVGQKRIERLKKKLHELHGKVKEVWIHASGEATGVQMGYIRFGANYSRWLENINDILLNTPDSVKITVMNTVNILCYDTFVKLVNDLLDLRKKYGDRLVLISFKYLVSPTFSDVKLLPENLKTIFLSDLKELMEKKSDHPYETGSLTESEIYSLKRLIEHVQLPQVEEEIIDLKKFFKEYDRRRGTSFIDTFPALAKEIKYETD